MCVRCTLLWQAGTNLFVTDNDIYSSGDVVSTLSNGAAGATYMHIARNRLWNGGTTHWGVSWKQCIYEDNVATGVSTTAMGSNYPQCVMRPCAHPTRTAARFAQHAQRTRFRQCRCVCSAQWSNLTTSGEQERRRVIALRQACNVAPHPSASLRTLGLGLRQGLRGVRVFLLQGGG
jgi:hypothetical protein